MSGVCVACKASADCPSDNPVCPRPTLQCGEYAANTDCPAGEPACDQQNGNREEFLVDAHCPGAAAPEPLIPPPGWLGSSPMYAPASSIR
jgi:hypothetical protein